MAYTLTDPFRAVRSVLRTSGATLLLFGILLMLFPRGTLGAVGITLVGITWSFRLAGGALVALSVYYLLAAGERSITTTTLIVSALGNGLVALILLFAYLQRELTTLSLLGIVLLVVVFIICLVGAVAPLRYLRAEYRDG